MADVFQTIRRSAVDMFSADGLQQRLAGGKRLKIKFGADPSRPDLHLGHSVPLRMLRKLQDAGHEIIFVIGDFTGMIGDPSGRSKTRVPLTFEQTRANGKSYFEQVAKILDPDKARITYNSQWLSKLNFADVLQLAGKYTLARILERDDFKNRYDANRPIGLHELFYPLMQGYDSIALAADIEVGGTDQTFNLLVGRELQRDYGQEPQEVITFPLLPGLDGVEKMSKSLGNYIGICEPADTMFEKCMRVPDTVLPDYFRLTTDIPAEACTAAMAQDIRQAHVLYAQEIVRLYHGEAAIAPAQECYRAVAAGNAPDAVAELTVPEAALSVIELLRRAGFAASNSEARRLIQGGGVKINGETVTHVDSMLQTDAVLSRGKNRFVQIRFPR
ncbi:MAG TPA: tyrosine--tRNA ligase [Candidatus Limiplasma sp.]|nr:tyrosine--tRNA ligase [Candidatus Limiplasma sp.]